MRTVLFGAAGAVVLATVLATAAHAQCVWTGYDWSCRTAYAPPSYYNPYWGPYPYNTYPTLNYPPSGYKPQWVPSYPGPRPSSGAGH